MFTELTESTLLFKVRLQFIDIPTRIAVSFKNQTSHKEKQ